MVQNSPLHGAKVVLVTQVCIKTMFVLFLNAENNKLGKCMYGISVLAYLLYYFLHIFQFMNANFLWSLISSTELMI